MSPALSGRLSARLCHKIKKEKESSRNICSGAAAAGRRGLIMIASFWAAHKADRHNIPVKRFLSTLTGKLFNPLW